ncbi:hypothetical protein FrEUN1fDRAFT_7106 [Parafrankia sp. EUN1f]|nr:hypothetical protein FrEUN1fDRAFT_7106 [Parafrankia sp. EUN1f]
MRRRMPGEAVSPYRHRRDRPTLRAIAEDLSAWLRPDLAALERAEPAMPVEDRAADTWEPLFAVAEHAGGPGPDRARRAPPKPTRETRAPYGSVSCSTAARRSARTPNSPPHACSNGSTATRKHPGQSRARPVSPGAGWLSCSATTASSANIRFPDGTQAKGYERAAFTDAWPASAHPRTFPRTSRPSRPKRPRTGQAGRPSVPDVRSADRPRSAMSSYMKAASGGYSSPRIRRP